MSTVASKTAPAVVGAIGCPYAEPPLIFNYGPPNAGKSVDAAKCFFAGLFLTAPSGGLTSVEANLKFSPKRIAVSTLWDVQTVLNEIASLGAGKNPYPALVLDDASVLCKNTLVMMEAKGMHVNERGKLDTRKLYAILSGELDKIRFQLRTIGIPGLLNFHDRARSTDNEGKVHIGGPDLGSAGQTKKLLPIVDLALRAALEPQRLPWAGYFECRSTDDPNWLYKDRYSVAPTKGPLNTAELLRAAGFTIPHPVAWMSEAASRIALEVEEATRAGTGQRLNVYSRWAAYLLNQGLPEHLVQWACQDGLDRAEIRMVMAAERLSRMGLRVGSDGKTYEAAR